LSDLLYRTLSSICCFVWSTLGEFPKSADGFMADLVGRVRPNRTFYAEAHWYLSGNKMQVLWGARESKARLWVVRDTDSRQRWRSCCELTYCPTAPFK
jgi:hypothetical protein